MLGEHSQALEILDEAQQLMEEGRSRSEEDLKLTVEMLTTKLIHGDKLSTKTIVQMNKAAIMLCQGDLVAAKNQLDELLEDQNLRVVQTDPSQNELIPDYLVNLLVYFLMVTSKYPLFAITAEFVRNREPKDGASLDEVSPLHARHQPHRSYCHQWESYNRWLPIRHCQLQWSGWLSRPGFEWCCLGRDRSGRCKSECKENQPHVYLKHQGFPLTNLCREIT